MGTDFHGFFWGERPGWKPRMTTDLGLGMESSSLSKRRRRWAPSSIPLRGQSLIFYLRSANAPIGAPDLLFFGSCRGLGVELGTSTYFRSPNPEPRTPNPGVVTEGALQEGEIFEVGVAVGEKVVEEMAAEEIEERGGQRRRGKASSPGGGGLVWAGSG